MLVLIILHPTPFDFCYNCTDYCKLSNISGTKSPNLTVSRLVLQLSLCPIQWSQVLSREWRCSWSSADRRCSNYIWVIDNFIAYQGATYIRDLTVCFIIITHQWLVTFYCLLRCDLYQRLDGMFHNHHTSVIVYFLLSTKVRLILETWWYVS